LPSKQFELQIPVKVIEDAEQNLSPWQEWIQIATDVRAITNAMERISHK
jgi:hypothetical protein